MRFAGILLSLIVLLILSQNGVAQFVADEILARLNQKYGEPAYYRGVAVNRLIEEFKEADEATKLKEVNRFFNQFRYASDTKVWGVADYWATPFEFLGHSQGDCEDFVISKFFVLRALGVESDKLYLTYVKSLKHNAAHMVLSYFETPTSVPLVLDNYNPYILPASQRTDLVPVYSFNAESLFLAKSAGLGQSLPTDKIQNSQWETLLENYKRNKL